jgi:hypothetical protein
LPRRCIGYRRARKRRKYGGDHGVFLFFFTLFLIGLLNLFANNAAIS